MIKTAIVYIVAAFFEIAGCFRFCAWIHDGKSGLWIAPGIVSLMLLTWCQRRFDFGQKSTV